MALFSPVWLNCDTLALSPPASPQQLAGVACNLIHSEEQRHVDWSRSGRAYAAAAKAIQDSFDACPASTQSCSNCPRVDVHLRDFPGASERLTVLELEPASVDDQLALANAYFMAQKAAGCSAGGRTVLKWIRTGVRAEVEEPRRVPVG